MDITDVYVTEYGSSFLDFRTSANIASFGDNYSERGPFALTVSSHVVLSSVRINGSYEHGYEIRILGIPAY